MSWAETERGEFGALTVFRISLESNGRLLPNGWEPLHSNRWNYVVHLSAVTDGRSHPAADTSLAVLMDGTVIGPQETR